MRPVYLYVHIPKTAGTSVWTNLNRELRDRLVRHREKKPISGDTSAIDVVVGHHVTRSTADLFPAREVRFVTVLREPAAHVVSRYNWAHYLFSREQARKPRKFGEWLKEYRNPQARWLVARFNEVDGTIVSGYKPKQLLHEAQEVLKRFWLVGDAENLNETLSPLSEALGISCNFARRGKGAKVTGVHFPRALDRSPETDGHIRLACAVDLALYTQLRHPIAPQQAMEISQAAE